MAAAYNDLLARRPTVAGRTAVTKRRIITCISTLVVSRSRRQPEQGGADIRAERRDQEFAAVSHGTQRKKDGRDRLVAMKTR
jgi:hypothetical protein